MFSVQDPAVVAVAITGSHAIGQGDRWSDIDLAFAIDGELAEALGRWTELLCGEFGALHHWDLPFGMRGPASSAASRGRPSTGSATSAPVLPGTPV